MTRCCSNAQDERIDAACAYILGLAILHNDNRRSTKIMDQVREIGYSEHECFEALQLLVSTNIIETKTAGMMKRKIGVSLTSYAKNITTQRLFDDLKDKNISGSRHDLSSVAEKAIKVTTTAITLSTII